VREIVNHGKFLMNTPFMEGLHMRRGTLIKGEILIHGPGFKYLHNVNNNESVYFQIY
jgi:hypothetical protein